jgi:uncharacterized protein (TIGR03086 family)
VDTIDAYRMVGDWTADRFAAVRHEQMDDATPCRDWSVHDVMRHVIDGNLRFTAALSGSAERPGPEDDVVGDDAGVSYRRSVDGVVAGWQTDGAAERSMTLSAGEMPAAVVLAIMMTEQMLHGWDVARATGQDTTLDPELVTMADAIIRPAVESGLAETAYDAPLAVADDASPQERLLALTGRRP